MADAPTPRTTQSIVTEGVISQLDKLRDLPARIAESILEGLAKNPGEYIVLGMGFVVGYEGLDVMAYMMKPISDIFGKLGSVGANLAGLAGGPINPGALGSIVMDFANFPVQSSGLLDFAKIITGGAQEGLLAALMPNKHITPGSKMPSALGPGVSYYGLPPEGYKGDWPPSGTTLAKLEDEKLNAPPGESWKFELEQIVAEQKIKIVFGCLGAITAYMITRPGFVSSVVESVGTMVSGLAQGAGAAVPF